MAFSHRLSVAYLWQSKCFQMPQDSLADGWQPTADYYNKDTNLKRCQTLD